MNSYSFELPDQNGKIHKLTDYLGMNVIVYFYPKDSTPGCTKEACNFRDGRQVLEDLNVVVLGISKDSVASHKKFAEKHKLNFTLLSDSSGDTIKQFGAWGAKKMFGKSYEGIKRNTYLFDKKGNLVNEYENVNPMTHIGEIIKDLQKLDS
jgi:peroxiredoxin Q/BCP